MERQPDATKKGPSWFSKLGLADLADLAADLDTIPTRPPMPLWEPLDSGIRAQWSAGSENRSLWIDDRHLDRSSYRQVGNETTGPYCVYPQSSLSQEDINAEDRVPEAISLPASQLPYPATAEQSENIDKKYDTTFGIENDEIHMLKHDKPYKCDVPGCRRAGRGFTTVNDLARHRKSVHKYSFLPDSYVCASENCRNLASLGESWRRLDDFKKHVSHVHPSENQQELIARSFIKGHSPLNLPMLSSLNNRIPPPPPTPLLPPPSFLQDRIIVQNPTPLPPSFLQDNIIVPNPPPPPPATILKRGTESTFHDSALSSHKPVESKVIRDGATRVPVAQNSEEHAPNPLPSDSGYQSGVGTDTASVCSVNSDGSSLGLPKNFLQDFIAFFGEALIEKSNARQWAMFAFASHSPREFESKLNNLVKAYTIELASKTPTYWTVTYPNAARGAWTPTKIHQILSGATNLIQRYRNKIAQYVQQNAASAPTNDTSLSERLQDLGQQITLSKKLKLWATSGSWEKESSDRTLDVPVDDESIDDPEMEGLFPDLEPLQDMLVLSEAFRKLASNFHHELACYDGVDMLEIERLLEREDLKVQVGVGDYESNFEVEWSIAEFMQSQYDGNIPPISAVVVITGSTLNGQATTCAEYVTRVWPETGPFFLKLLDEVFAPQSAKSVQPSRYSWMAPGQLGLFVTACTKLAGESPPRKYSFYVRGSQSRWISELAQQLAWAGCALSVSHFGNELATARASLRKQSAQNFELTFKYDRLGVTEKACWLPLFSGAVIACGFPIPERADEKGLEISLELLAALAGIEHAVEYEGGVVMKGFSHMFVPIRKNANRVQWHAIASPNPAKRLSYQDGLSRCDSRALNHEVSLNDLSVSRAIVGWCSVVESRLGSHLANYENIDYSKSQEASSGIQCSGGSLGFQQWGTAALDFRFGAKDGVCHFQRDGPFQKIVSAAEETPVALHDTGEKRAWLVPASEVMLHMIQHRHHLKPFTVDEKPVDLQTTVTTESSASEVILRNKSLRLYEDDYTFEKEIRSIWSLLEFLLDQRVKRQCNGGKDLQGTFRHFLQGYEFKAVVRERSPFRLKETELSKTCGEWPQLLRDIDALVLLADGFEDLLVPAAKGNTGLCRQWSRVPKGLDYLSCSTKVLLQLYDEAGNRLDREHLTSKSHMKWHQGDSLLFDACSDPRNCGCDRVQQLFPKSAFGNVRCPKIVLKNAAVIFGRSSLDVFPKRCPQAPEATHIYSQANTPLSPIAIYSESVDSRSSDGSCSAWGDSNTFGASTPSSSSSHTTATYDVPGDVIHRDHGATVIGNLQKRRYSISTKFLLCETEENRDTARKRMKYCQKPCTLALSQPQDIQESAHHHNYQHVFGTQPTTETSPTQKLSDFAQDTGSSLAGETLGHPTLPMRIAEEVPLRALRRREGFNWEKTAPCGD